MLKYRERGVAHLLLLLIILGVIGFIIIANTASFKNTLFSNLFPKPKSQAYQLLPSPGNFEIPGSTAPVGASKQGINDVIFQSGKYIFKFSGQNRYSIDTNDPNVRKGILKIRDEINNSYLTSSAGTTYRQNSGTILNPISLSQAAQVSFTFTQPSSSLGDNMVRFSYTDIYQGKTTQKIYDFRIIGQTLMIHFYQPNQVFNESPLGNYAGLSFGTIDSTVVNSQVVDIGYLNTLSAPIIIAGPQNSRYFFSVYFDQVKSNSNGPLPSSAPTISSVNQFEPKYITNTAGHIYNPLNEMVYITSSNNIDDVMLSPNRSPDQYRSNLSDRVFWDSWNLSNRFPGSDPFFVKSQKILTKLYDFGMERIWTVYHLWMESDNDEHTNPLINCYSPDHYVLGKAPSNIMGGDTEFQRLSTKAQEHQGLFSIHTIYNYIYRNDPQYSASPNPDSAGIALNERGSPQSGYLSWFCSGPGPLPSPGTPENAYQRSRAVATNKMLEFFQRYGPELNTFNPNAAFFDVTPGRSLYEYIDFNPANPNARTYKQTYNNILNLINLSKETYSGPFGGESRRDLGAIDRYLAGVADSNESKLLSGWKAKLIPDFELKQIVPLMVNKGVGFWVHWRDSGGNSIPFNMSMIDFDRFRTAQIAYGHTGFMQQSGFDQSVDLNDLYKYWTKEYYIFKDLQSQYLSSNLSSILYLDNCGSFVALSQALQPCRSGDTGADFYNNKLKISYSNGLIIYINYHACPQSCVSTTIGDNLTSPVWDIVAQDGRHYYLPPNSWVAVNTDPQNPLVNYSGLIDPATGNPSISGVRADYVKTKNYVMVDGRGTALHVSNFLNQQVIVNNLAVFKQSCSVIEAPPPASHYGTLQITGDCTSAIAPTPTPTIAPLPTPTATPRTTPTATPSSTSRPSSTPTSNPSSTPNASPKPGDINGDGRVDVIDYGIFVADFGSTSGVGLRSDINHDGVVNVIDYGIFVANFGR